MKVQNRQQAWNEVNKLIPNDYLKDYERAGYSIYRSTANIMNMFAT